MKSTPKPEENVAKILEMFRGPQLTEEQKAKIAKQKERYHDALNMLYKTGYGELVIRTFMEYCHYWDSLFNYKDTDRALIQTQQEMIRALILRELSAENLADLISKTRKEA